MTECNGNRVRCIVRPRNRGQMQDPADHIHNLPFFCLSISDDGLFHLHGRVFVYRHTTAKSTKQNNTAGMCNGNSCCYIFAEKKLFDRNRIRLTGQDQFFQIGIDPVES